VVHASASGPYQSAMMLDAHERALHGTPELQLLRILGLFDRQIEETAIHALVETSPPIRELTDQLQTLNRYKINAAIARLENIGLANRSKAASSTQRLGCHPLIREHQKQRMKTNCYSAWCEVNARLFHYFSALPREQTPSAFEKIDMLCQAVVHGCEAGLYSSAFEDIYWPRISRRADYFITDRLGYVHKDLATLAAFFDQPWSDPAATLNATQKATILNLCGFRLRTVGRLEDAKSALTKALINFEALHSWEDASGAANNLAVLLRMEGDLDRAIEEGEKALEYAKLVDDLHVRIRRMAALAEFYHYRGDLNEALALFEQAEILQARCEPDHPRLYSRLGFRFCELLLTLGRFKEVQDRAPHIPSGRMQDDILDKAFACLCTGRALMQQSAYGDHNLLKEAEKLLRTSYDLMQKSHNGDNEVRGCIALAECLRLQGRLLEASEFITEAVQIAEAANMNFHRLDCEFERLQLELVNGSAETLRSQFDALANDADKMQYRLLLQRIQSLFGQR